MGTDGRAGKRKPPSTAPMGEGQDGQALLQVDDTANQFADTWDRLRPSSESVKVLLA